MVGIGRQRSFGTAVGCSDIGLGLLAGVSVGQNRRKQWSMGVEVFEEMAVMISAPEAIGYDFFVKLFCAGENG